MVKSDEEGRGRVGGVSREEMKLTIRFSGAEGGHFSIPKGFGDD